MDAEISLRNSIEDLDYNALILKTIVYVWHSGFCRKKLHLLRARFDKEFEKVLAKSIKEVVRAIIKFSNDHALALHSGQKKMFMEAHGCSCPGLLFCAAYVRETNIQ